MARFSCVQIDEWIDYSPNLSVGSVFEKACAHVDTYLTSRTFLVGNYLSIADIAISAGLAGIFKPYSVINVF